MRNVGAFALGGVASRVIAAQPPVSRATAPASPQLAVQLYTVRDQVAQDLPGTLRRLKALGYNSVETAFWPKGVSLAQAARAIQEAGLSVCSSHIELPVGENRAAMLAVAKAYSCNTMIWHGWPEDKRYSSLEGTRALAAIYNECNRVAKDNGLRFGLHNHWWEYRNRVGGKFVYEVLLEELQPDIFCEVDTYWVKVAGHEPATILTRLGARAPLLHIKDGPARWHAKLAEDNPDPMTAVGHGTQNMPAIAAAARGHAEWFIVEMDKTATDVFAALQQSRDYLVRHAMVAAK